MYQAIIQNILDYIEENLRSELSAQELSELAGFSKYYFYRLFQNAVGISVMQYVQQRKLLNAIYEISLGNSMIDVALQYGFETYAGFYKAFLREFGYTPKEFLKSYKVKKPHRINIIGEEYLMVSHKKITEVLKYWGLEKEKISDVVYEETGNRSESSCYVGEKYVIKFSANLEKIRNAIRISQALDGTGLNVAKLITTLDGEEYIMDGEVYYFVYERIVGERVKASELYEDVGKSRYIGEIIGYFDKALEQITVPVKDTNIYEIVLDSALPKLKVDINISNEMEEEYKTVFGNLYSYLPKQVIHRDPNPGNIILDGDKWGFVDFELGERNVRVFDPCYAATAILSESFDEKDNVVLSNQMIATAWFAGKEKYKELYVVNMKMTKWILENFDEVKKLF